MSAGGKCRFQRITRSHAGDMRPCEIRELQMALAHPISSSLEIMQNVRHPTVLTLGDRIWCNEVVIPQRPWRAESGGPSGLRDAQGIYQIMFKGKSRLRHRDFQVGARLAGRKRSWRSVPSSLARTTPCRNPVYMRGPSWRWASATKMRVIGIQGNVKGRGSSCQARMDREMNGEEGMAKMAVCALDAAGTRKDV